MENSIAADLGMSTSLLTIISYSADYSTLDAEISFDISKFCGTRLP
jgi:hypothetical protein